MPASSLIHVSDLTREVSGIYKKHFFDFLKVTVYLIIPSAFSALVPILPISLSVKSVFNFSLSIIIALISLWLSVIIVDMSISYLKNPTKKFKPVVWSIGGRVVDFAIISLLQGVVILAGFILFIIPGIIFSIWFSFARYAVLIDDSSPGSKALVSSKTLVAGRFWNIVWRWFGSYLYFGSFLGLGTIIILALIGAFTGNPAAAFIYEEPAWWTTLIVSLVSIIVTPLFVLVGVLLYEDAKKTK